MAAEYTTTPAKIAPAAANPVSITPSAVAWQNSAWVQLIASTSTAIVLLAIEVDTGVAAEYEIEIGKGAAGLETVVGTLAGNVESVNVGMHQTLVFPIPISNIASGTRVVVRLRKSGTSTVVWGAKLIYAEGATLAGNATVTAVPSKVVPAGAAGVSVTPSGTSWANSAYGQLSAALGTNGIVIAGIVVNSGVAQPREIDIAAGAAGSEVVLTTLRHVVETNAGANFTVMSHPPYSNSTALARYAVRMRKNGTGVTAETYKLIYYELPV